MSNVNISPQNVQGKCDNKCMYEYDYPNTNLVATNIGTMIMLKGDNSKPCVVYNTEKYEVSCMFISSPSVHLFNNSNLDGEILIEHECVTGGPKLIVCVPIKVSGETSPATTLLTTIINNVAANAPSSGETTNINISDFTLNDIVPKKPFFSYTGNDMSDSDANFIVFGAIESIPLSSTTISSLSSIISASTINTQSNGLFYNSTGPGKKNNDGIYISCKPTGASEDTTTITTGSSSDSSDSIWNNPTGKLVIEIIIGVVIFLILFSIINYAYIYATADPLKLTKPSAGKK
jgi:hypothetical protein